MESAATRAQRYRSKAEEARIIAEGLKDNAARRMLMTVAHDYLAMADRLDHATGAGETTRQDSPVCGL